MLHLLLVAALALQAPVPVAAPPPSDSGALRIFLDCATCDFDFLRTEITFVNYVRDRHDAQVYVLVSTEGTGAGGTAYTLTFIGQGAFEGRSDTLVYAAGPAESPDMVRHGLAQKLELGLVRYAAHTSLADQIAIGRRSAGPGGGAGAAPPRRPHDPWNYWVFKVGVNGSLNGQSSTKYSSFMGNLSANRTTEAWKLSLGLSGSRSRNAYQLTDTSQYVSVTHSYSFSGLVVRSLSRHWSAGLRASALSSTYSYQDLTASLSPAVEYDLFPYAQSTRRQLRINYALGGARLDYHEVTIFGKTLETHLKQDLEVALGLAQRWGTVNVSLSGSQYLHDLRKYDVGVYGGVDLRLVRGLSFSAYASYSRIHDQLYLPAAGATPEEILAQQRELATSYSYYTFFGLSYTFGSMFNNVVNPRFGSSGGSTMTISF
jgi:hypothetical protein